MGLKTGGYIKVEDMGPFHVASQKNFFRHAEKFYLEIFNKWNLSACLKKIFETPHEMVPTK